MTAFLALLRRDLVVAGRNALMLLAATLTQPVLFGNILPRLHLVAEEFRTVMVPGLMSITMLMAGVQGVLMPLSTDLGGSREVAERLLAPISVLGVSIQKVVAGAIHAGMAGLVALPAMMLLMHQVAGVSVHPRWLVLLPCVALSGLLSAAFGAGALVGALTAASFGRASAKVMIAGSLVFTGSELLLAPVHSPILAGSLLFLTGAGFTAWSANANASMQLAAPDRLRGRIIAIYFYAFNGTGPIAGLLAGWLCARGGTELAFAVAGVAGLAGTAAAAVKLSRRPPKRSAPEFRVASQGRTA